MAMDRTALRRAAHDIEPTVWVGKAGIETAVDELDAQLADREFVKARFLASARGEGDTEALAADLAERVGAAAVEVRGHTAVFAR